MCAVDFEKISLLIIAGGKSSRLGEDKRFIKIGGVPLLENVLRKSVAQKFSEIFLCVEENFSRVRKLGAKYDAKILVDEVRNAGALSGITNGLQHSKNDCSLAVSCDMPFFDFEILKSIDLSEVSAVIPIVGGRRQMLGAFYHKSATEIFSYELANNRRKISDAVAKFPHKFTEIANVAEKFFNVNTPADLKLARGRAENLAREVPIISVVAPTSGTGKTTFIEKVTINLTTQGIKVGVIKSDAHGFNLDWKGKDSQRFQNAGAKSVAVVSPNGFFLVQKTDERENFLNVAAKFDGVDLILTESRTHGIFPSISLWRGKGEVIRDEKIVAIFSSELEAAADFFQADLNDVETAAKLILFLAGKKAGDFLAS